LRDSKENRKDERCLSCCASFIASVSPAVSSSSSSSFFFFFFSLPVSPSAMIGSALVASTAFLKLDATSS
jgi:hypothetical protein